MAAPILFLDIDGVVLSGQELWRTHNNRYLPPEKVALIREVCDRAGAMIVVSSTWRYSDDTLGQLIAAGLPVHSDWRTPQARREGAIFIAETRGWEISRWLVRHPEVTSWAIIDDDSDMLPEQLPRFVQTPFETGVDQKHVERLVGLLAA
jgi:hypothetical protein